MITPIPKATWRKDPEDIFRAYVRGKELPTGTVVDVEARSGAVKRVTLTGTHSQVNGGYLYWYKPVSVIATAPTADIVVTEAVPEQHAPDVTQEELDVALGF